MADSTNRAKTQPAGVECRKNLDGTDNSKYIDILEEDRPLAAQKFVCMSFVSPEKILKQREQFLFNEYIKQWDMNKSLEKFNQFINFMTFKYHLDTQDVMKDFEDYCKTERDNIFVTTIEDEYKTFLDNNEDKLQEEFNEKHTFQTSVRGIKLRGSYPNQQEAELRCKLLREVDPTHDVYVGPVGSWMPFHPEAYKTGRVEYMEEELNQLMQEKMKNEKSANIEFEKRVKESKRKAMEENQKRAIESNNPLTQMLNNKGDLVSVANANTTETNLEGNSDVAVADIRKELFEGDNVITNFKGNDHGFSNLTVIKEAKKKAEGTSLSPVLEDKMQEDQMEEDKVLEDKVLGDKVQEDQMEEDKVQEDKVLEVVDSNDSENVVFNDDNHVMNCVNGVCMLPSFKKCVSTGKKGEIICECMIDKNNSSKDDVEDV